LKFYILFLYLIFLYGPTIKTLVQMITPGTVNVEAGKKKIKEKVKKIFQGHEQSGKRNNM
jgi:hypothetical protein